MCWEDARCWEWGWALPRWAGTGEQSRFLPLGRRRAVSFSLPGVVQRLMAILLLPGPWQPQPARTELGSFWCHLFSGPSFVSAKGTEWIMLLLSWMWKGDLSKQQNPNIHPLSSTNLEWDGSLKTGRQPSPSWWNGYSTAKCYCSGVKPCILGSQDTDLPWSIKSDFCQDESLFCELGKEKC